MKLSRPFIRLPLAFDAARLRAELEAMPATAWMPHPSGLAGNSALALISRDGTDNDEFDGAMAATPPPFGSGTLPPASNGQFW